MTRVCFISRVRADRLDEYRARHAAVWPEMLEALRDSGWSDYTLHLGTDGLLVGFLQTADFPAARAAMAATQVNARWQAEMAQFFLTPGNPDEGFAVLDEVFDLDAQLRAAGLPTAGAQEPQA
jgi:L-rhamnose mutarotase